MAVDPYFLPSDYRPNEVNVTLDAVSGSEYWDDARIAASGRYQWAAYRMASRLAHERGARRVLDLGCGVATKLTRCFDPDEYELFGVDQAPAVETCRRLGRPGTYFADDFERPSESVRNALRPIDLVICSDVIEHLLDPVPLLDYVRSVLSPSGLLVLTTPERDALHGPGATRPRNAAHVREWSSGEFQRFLESRRFEVLSVEVLAPFRFLVDRMTAEWVLTRLRARRPLRTNLVVTCRPLMSI